MANFEYLAIGADNSKQTGVISAPNEIEAKSELHKLGMSVLKLSKTTKAVTGYDIKKSDLFEKDDLVIVFEFSGYDKNGDKTEGTIEANSNIKAYKRLVEEFFIDIEWIVQKSTQPSMKEIKKKTSVEEILEQAYEQGIEIKSRIQKNQVDNDDLINIGTKEEHDQLKFEIEEFINKIKKIIEKYPNILSIIEKSEINKKIFELEKIKRSNNIFYIQGELNNTLEYFLRKFNKDIQKGLDEESLAILKEIDVYIGFGAKSAILEKIILIFEKLSFFKTLYLKFNERLNLSVSPEINQQKQRIYNYFQQLFYHIRGTINSKGEDRQRHIRIIFKSWKLILNSYQTYSKLKDKIYDKQYKFDVKSISKYNRFYSEIRVFTGWLIFIYLTYYIILKFSVTKGILLPLEPSMNTLNSPLLNSFVYFIFSVNFMILLKTKYFGKSILFNFIGLILIIFSTMFFYNNF